jgi:non-specific serine/threonine protein kinase
VDQSLVVAEEHHGEVRYLLLETIRQYAAEKLRDAGEEATARDRHRDWALQLAERAWPEIWGPGQVEWLGRLEAEHDNLRAALTWSRQAVDGEAGLTLGWLLWQFWDLRGYYGEGRAHLAGLLAVTPGNSEARARALAAAGLLAYLQDDLAAAHALLDEGLAVGRALGHAFSTAYALGWLAAARTSQGDLSRAAALFEQGRSLLPSVVEELDRFMLDTLLDIWEAELAWVQHDDARAGDLLDTGLARARERGDRSICCVFLFRLGLLALKQADYERAATLQREALVLGDATGNQIGILLGLIGLTCVASAQGRMGRAARLLGAAEAMRGLALLHYIRADHELALTAARANLGEAAFAAAWAAGRALPLEEAIGEALSAAEPESPAAAIAQRPAVAGPADPLSSREREVAALVARGRTNRQIAEALVVSQRTVEWHVANLLGKLGLETKPQLAIWARDHGLGAADGAGA